MARVGSMRQLWKPRLTGAPGPSRRTACAFLTLAVLALACFAAGPLSADEFPGSVVVNSSLPQCDAPQMPFSARFTFNAQQAPFWSATADLEPQFAAIDGAQPAPIGFPAFGMIRTAPESGRSSFWTVLGRWEANLWRPERPTLVLTSAETVSVHLDGQASNPSSDEAGVAPAQTIVPPGQTGSELQSIDGCACPPISFRDDAWAFLPRVAHDAWGVVNNWDNLIVLGTALGGSLALRGEVDQDVRNYTAEHPDRWGDGSKALGDIGVVQYQLPVLFAAYAFTVWHQDEYEHQMMNSMISAYTIFGLSTLTIKGIADTKRPSSTWNGGNYGFPSWHDGSLFCISAVVDDYEGHWIGVPLYILSGLVGWSRLDTRDHDLSDVVFGGVLGYVIGKSVAGRALYGDSRAVHIVPYVHPGEGTAGVMFDASF
jgi:hypothetical protein